jgi:FkbM family methyltransferase
MKSPFAKSLQTKFGRCRDLCLGIKNNLTFSNGLQLNFQRLFCRSTPEVIYVWRNRIRIACDCSRGEHFGVHEVFTHQCYAPFLDRCDFPGKRIRHVDIGANVGAFTLGLLARGLELERGIAVELNPSTFERCVRNLQSNRPGSVRAVNCGVAARDGWINFVPSADALGDNIFTSAGEPTLAHREAARVELVSLETLLRRHAEHESRFDLLKLDCERAEYGILRETPADVLRRFRYLLVEFHSEPAGESVSAAFVRLGELGFVTEQARPVGVPFVALFARRD